MQPPVDALIITTSLIITIITSITSMRAEWEGPSSNSSLSILCHQHLTFIQNDKTLPDSCCMQEYRQAHTHTASVSALIEHTPSKGENSSVYFISIVSIKISAICGYSSAWKTKVIIFVYLQTALTQEVFPRILSLSVRLPKISLS